MTGTAFYALKKVLFKIPFLEIPYKNFNISQKRGNSFGTTRKGSFQ